MASERESLERWEEILSQPVASLREDGWRAMLPLQSVARLPATPLPVLAPPAAWLISPPRPQPETAGRRLPPSLADQLSLTWASRRRRRGATTAGVPFEPAATDRTDSDVDEVAPEPAEEARPSPVWARPLRLLRAVLGRPVQPRSPAAGPTDESPQPRSPAAVAPGRSVRRTAPDPGRERPPTADRTAAVLEQESRGMEPAEREPTLREALSHRLLRRPRPAERTPPATAAADAGGRPEPGGATRDALPASRSETPAAGAAPTPLEHRRTAEPAGTGVPRREAQGAPQTEVVTPLEPADRPVAATAAAPPQHQQPTEAEEPGEPLSPGLRQRVEGLLDVRLRDVRIFRTARAQRAAHSLRADAVTVGQSVLLGERATRGSPAGDALIAHELAHVAARNEPAAPVAPVHEEGRALRLEHAVHRARAAPAVAGAPPAAAPAGPALSLAAPAAFSAPGSTAPAVPPLGGGGTAPLVVARAPEDRAAPGDEPAGGPGEVAAAPDEQAGLNEEQVAGLIDRAVEAMLRRLRRDAAQERERRGAFHSSIGG